MARGFVDKRIELRFTKDEYKIVMERARTLFGPNGTLTQYCNWLYRNDLVQSEIERYRSDFSKLTKR